MTGLEKAGEESPSRYAMLVREARHQEPMREDSLAMRITRVFSLSSTPPSRGEAQKRRSGKTWIVALWEISIHWIAAFTAVGLLTLAGGCGPGGPFGSGGGPATTTRQSPIVANNKNQVMTCALYARKYKRCNFPCEVKNKKCVPMASQSPCQGKQGKACAIAKGCKWVPIDSKDANGGVCFNINTQVEICDVKRSLDWQDFCAKRLDKGAASDADQKKLCEQEINRAQPCVHQAGVQEECKPIADTGNAVCVIIGRKNAAEADGPSCGGVKIIKSNIAAAPSAPCAWAGACNAAGAGTQFNGVTPAQYCATLFTNVQAKATRKLAQVDKRSACEGASAVMSTHATAYEMLGVPVCKYTTPVAAACTHNPQAKANVCTGVALDQCGKEKTATEGVCEKRTIPIELYVKSTQTSNTD